MLEKEYKSLLSLSDYEKLEAMFSWDSVKTQVNNYYCDDEKITRKNKIMFRVREKDNKCSIQVKFHKNSSTPLHINNEAEFEIDSVPSQIENPERYTNIKTGPLKNIGFSKTLRHSKMWDSETEICLDKTEYFDICDYEIEVEFTGNDMPSDLKDILYREGIEFKNATPGKFSRFLKAAEERGL